MTEEQVNRLTSEIMDEEEETIYHMENDPIEDIDRAESHANRALSDVYDFYDLMTSVHSPVSDVTRDFTLSKYDGNIIHNKFAKFIREQLKVIRIIEDYLIIPLEVLETKYQPEFAKKIYDGLLYDSQSIKNLLLSEIYVMIIMARAEKGEVRDAMLVHGKTPQELEKMEHMSNEQEDNRGGIFDRRSRDKKRT